MSPIALLLVVIAACTHAGWNILAKRAAHCRHLNWYTSIGAVVLYLPFAATAFRAWMPHITTTAMLVLLATSVLHALYSASLQRGYRVADLSIVYPIARGTGPLLSFFGAILVLRERPTAVAAVGAALVVIGVFLVAGGRSLWRPRHASDGRTMASLRWGATTGLLIAGYTLNDGYAVKVLLIAPILVDYAGNAFRVVAFAPVAWHDRAAIPAESGATGRRRSACRSSRRSATSSFSTRSASRRSAGSPRRASCRC